MGGRSGCGSDGLFVLFCILCVFVIVLLLVALWFAWSAFMAGDGALRADFAMRATVMFAVVAILVHVFRVERDWACRRRAGWHKGGGGADCWSESECDDDCEPKSCKPRKSKPNCKPRCSTTEASAAAAAGASDD